jgi:hypothetical protein
MDVNCVRGKPPRGIVVGWSPFRITPAILTRWLMGGAGPAVSPVYVREAVLRALWRRTAPRCLRADRGRLLGLSVASLPWAVTPRLPDPFVSTSRIREGGRKWASQAFEARITEHAEKFEFKIPHQATDLCHLDDRNRCAHRAMKHQCREDA